MFNSIKKTLDVLILMVHVGKGSRHLPSFSSEIWLIAYLQTYSYDVFVCYCLSARGYFAPMMKGCSIKSYAWYLRPLSKEGCLP